MSGQSSALLALLEHPPAAGSRWVVGYSGGLDSTVLLSLASQIAQQSSSRTTPDIVAFHINHQLSPQSADWVDHCQRTAVGMGVEFHTTSVVVGAGPDGPEAAARQARYAAFENFLCEDDILLLAHHQDDQIETFFLRLMRGSDASGLGGMPAMRRVGRALLWRPLLDIPRSEIACYAQVNELSWIEDDSNQELHFDRNYLRHQVLPALEERWPAYRQSAATSMELLRRSSGMLDLALDERLRLMSGLGSRDEPMLDVELLLTESSEQAQALLRRWLDHYGVGQPGRSQLVELLRQLDSADTASLDQTGYRLQSYRCKLYLLPAEVRELPEPGSVAGYLTDRKPLQVPGLGKLSASKTAGEGLRVSPDQRLEIRFRRGGERCRPHERDRTQSLKKLLQEYQVAPWWRDQIPLVYDGEKLVAVADLWVCAGYLPAADERGWMLEWRPPTLTSSS